MNKEFLPYNVVRNDALKLAHKIYNDGFYPDVMFISLRGGAYMANVMSEYFKIVKGDRHPVYLASVVCHSYSDVRANEKMRIDGWTCTPNQLRAGDKILLVDDIFDTGNTINYLVGILLAAGVPREDIKVVVHDYKYYPNKKEQQPIQPDYYCRKFIVNSPDEESWIHYMSHELIGLTNEELEEYYFKDDPELREVLKPLVEMNNRKSK